MKWLWRALACIGVALAGLIALSWTPDTDPADMRAKYGTGSAFAPVSDGYAIHYRDAGCADCPALLLIHGLNSSLQTWDAMTAVLADRFRIVTLDLPGHGLTGPHPGGDYTQAGAEDAIAAVLAATGISRFSIGGNSLGGGVAWAYALSHPVEALILLDPTGAPRAPSEEPPASNIGFRLMNMPGVIDLMTVITPRTLIRMSLEQSVFDPTAVTEEAVDRYWELLRFPGNRRAAIDRMRTDHGASAFDRLAELRVPTLMIWGKQDALIPVERAALFKALLPHAQLEVMGEVGHLPMEEAPERTAALIRDFWARTFGAN